MVGCMVAVAVGAAGTGLAVAAAVALGSTVALGNSASGVAVEAVNTAGSTTNVAGIWAATGSAQPASSKLATRKYVLEPRLRTAIFYSLFPPCLPCVTGIISAKCQ